MWEWTVRDEPEEVDVAAPLAGAVERPPEGGVVGEAPVGDRLVDADEVLVENAARADRQVADLGVAHLPGREAYCLAGSLERGVWVLGPEAVEDGRVRQLDRVPRARRRAAPAVEDDERYEVGAARQIAVNDSTSSEAPPTRAPSTPGCARSSAALSGLSEPP